jgi:hypothetical protein
MGAAMSTFEAKTRAVWSFEEKLQLATAMCLDQKLAHAELRIALVMLLHFHNSASGALFPSRRQIGEATGCSKRTVERTTKKLRKLSYIDFNAVTGGRGRHNSYTFKRATPEHPFSDKGRHQSTTTGDRGAPHGGDTRAPRTNPLNIPKKESEASTSTLNGSSASPESEDPNYRHAGREAEGLQWNPEAYKKRPLPAAKADPKRFTRAEIHEQWLRDRGKEPPRTRILK